MVTPASVPDRDGAKVHIVCKPRLADFIQHTDGLAGFNHISQNHVDFLVCRQGDWMPMLGIEVDDSSHNRKDRRERDTFVNNLFAHVGVPLLRIGVKEVEDIELLVRRLTDGWHNRCLHLERRPQLTAKTPSVVRPASL